MKCGRIDVEGEGKRDSSLLRFFSFEVNWNIMPQYCGQECAGAHISPINSSIFSSIFALHKKILFLRLYQAKQEM